MIDHNSIYYAQFKCIKDAYLTLLLINPPDYDIKLKALQDEYNDLLKKLEE